MESSNRVIFLNSTITIRMVIPKARKSAIGPAYKMPSIPIASGRRNINGRRKRICLVRDKKIPL